MAKQEFDNRKRGVLFKNDRKQKDTDPDFSGEITLPDGTTHFLSGWKHKHKDMGSYVRMSIGDEKTGSKGGDKGGFSKKKAPKTKTTDDDDDMF